MSNILTLYYCRRRNQNNEENRDFKSRPPVTSLAYPPEFKLEVALYAKTHSQYASAKVNV